MKITTLFILTLFIVSFIVVSSAESIGQRQDAQVGIPYIISQPCATCTYINISILTKDGIIVQNVPMTNNGSTWIYSFTANDSLRHDVNGIGDKDGVDDSFAFWFDATLSGQQNNIHIVISDIILLLALIGIIVLVSIKHKNTDFDIWNADITKNHKHMGQTFVSAFIYTLFKNSFIWVYFIVWLFILVLKDVVFRFNSSEIYEYFTLIANIYSLGLILVSIYMIGHFASYMRDTLNTLSDNNWGVGNNGQ